MHVLASKGDNVGIQPMEFLDEFSISLVKDEKMRTQHYIASELGKDLC